MSPSRGKKKKKKRKNPVMSFTICPSLGHNQRPPPHPSSCPEIRPLTGLDESHCSPSNLLVPGGPQHPCRLIPIPPSLPFSLLLHAYCSHLPLLFSPLILPFFFPLLCPLLPTLLPSPLPQGSAQQGWHSPRVPPFPPHLI